MSSDFSQGEFQGKVLQSLEDIKEDIRNLKEERRNMRYIQYVLTIIVSAITSTVTGRLPLPK